MATIHTSKPASMTESLMQVPARTIPSYRVLKATENNARTNLLFRMHGGLGDIVCAEPAVRYALSHFKECKFSLLTLYPGLFQHLKFEEVFTQENVHTLVGSNYLLYENTDTSNELAAEFISHPLMHGIDYASLYMWRKILSNKDKEILLVPTVDEYAWASSVSQPNDVLIHPGRTWKTRTFPKKWWDSVITNLLAGGARPVIIGGNVDNGRATTIDIALPEGVLDLRLKTSLMQSVALMHRTQVLLTNDSAPLHMATTGDTWIGFLSTVKHPDHLYTWRKGQFGWRMQDFAEGRVYDTLDICPNKKDSVRVDDCDIQDMLKWLPAPEAFAAWALQKLTK